MVIYIYMKYSILGKGKNKKKIFSYLDFFFWFSVKSFDLIQWPDAELGGGDSYYFIILPLYDLDPIGLDRLEGTTT